MRADCTILLAITLMLGALPACVHAEDPAYGKVETFQPGKKYNCVPAVGSHGWDCKEIGKADIPAPDSSAAAAQPNKLTESAPASSTRSHDATPGEAALTTHSSESAPAATALPNYLTKSSAAGNPRTAPASSSSVATAAAAAASARSDSTPARSASIATPASPPAANVPTTTPTQPAARNHGKSATSATESTAQAPAPSTSASTAVAPSPSPASPAPSPPSATHPAIVNLASRESQNDFLALRGDHYVIELANAPRQDDLPTASDATQVPRGKVYELHLRQNDADEWLLVWGDFDTIQAARTARDELIASGTTSPGWPRRVAPLQAEVRNARE